MKFENRGKWLKEAEEKDNLVFDERTKVDFNEDEEINGELAAEVESDEFIDELDRPEEEEDAIVMADESSQKNEADKNAERDLIAKVGTIKTLAKRLTNDNLVPQLSSFKKYVDDVYNFAVKHFSESSQKNEDGTSWKAVLELRAPSSMNNKAVEDKLEKVIEQNGMTVLDVTAERN